MALSASGSRCISSHCKISPSRVIRPPSVRKSTRVHAFFDFLKPKAKPPPKPEPRPTVIPGPNYAIPITLLSIAGFEAYETWTGVAAFTAVLGIFLGIQATRIRYQFTA